MKKAQAISRLQKFIKTLVRSKVKDSTSFKRWRAKNEAMMAKLFAYKREPKMPPITALVKPFFHPKLPLIGLNYTPVAHNTLHAAPSGWTLPLRLCRGIVFDRQGNLVALPFPKFFNCGEHPETQKLPDEPFTATVKYDGHLGIIFEYGGNWILTSRGSFVSATSVLGNRLLGRHVLRHGRWLGAGAENLTLLVEIIHPQTKVHLDYGQRKGFVLIGAYDRKTLYDLTPGELQKLGFATHLQVTERPLIDSIQKLQSRVADTLARNEEGFVIRFQSGLRVKFKYQSYINLMVADKLSYTYLMNRVIAGNLGKMIDHLPEEIYGRAQEMVVALMRAKKMRRDEKTRRQYLYGLVPAAESTSYYRGVCRKFLKHISQN